MLSDLFGVAAELWTILGPYALLQVVTVQALIYSQSTLELPTFLDRPVKTNEE